MILTALVFAIVLVVPAAGAPFSDEDIEEMVFEKICSEASRDMKLSCVHRDSILIPKGTDDGVTTESDFSLVGDDNVPIVHLYPARLRKRWSWSQPLPLELQKGLPAHPEIRPVSLESEKHAWVRRVAIGQPARAPVSIDRGVAYYYYLRTPWHSTKKPKIHIAGAALAPNGFGNAWVNVGSDNGVTTEDDFEIVGADNVPLHRVFPTFASSAKFTTQEFPEEIFRRLTLGTEVRPVSLDKTTHERIREQEKARKKAWAATEEGRLRELRSRSDTVLEKVGDENRFVASFAHNFTGFKPNDAFAVLGQDNEIIAVLCPEIILSGAFVSKVLSDEVFERIRPGMSVRLVANDDAGCFKPGDPAKRIAALKRDLIRKPERHHLVVERKDDAARTIIFPIGKFPSTIGEYFEVVGADNVPIALIYGKEKSALRSVSQPLPEEVFRKVQPGMALRELAEKPDYRQGIEGGFFYAVVTSPDPVRDREGIGGISLESWPHRSPEAYRAAARKKIQHSRILPFSPPIDSESTVEFEITRNGNTGGVRMLAGTGDGRLDEAAMRAVRAAAPFGSLPDAFGEDKMTVRFQFICQEKAFCLVVE